MDLDSVNRAALARKLGWSPHSIRLMFSGNRDAKVTETYMIARALGEKPIDVFEALLLARARYYKKHSSGSVGT